MHRLHIQLIALSLRELRTAAQKFFCFQSLLVVISLNSEHFRRWKFNGPSDSFLALVDMAAVHSSCRLCIFVATKSRLKEEAAAPKRPCKCTSKSGSTLYHLYVRERGRFEMESVFIE